MKSFDMTPSPESHLSGETQQALSNVATSATLTLARSVNPEVGRYLAVLEGDESTLIATRTLDAPSMVAFLEEVRKIARRAGVPLNFLDTTGGELNHF
jgi:hypothetical protein